MNFSVAEVAKMLETNPETVRRWIRSGKLEAKKSKGRSGSVISEIVLRQFLEDSPKYKKYLPLLTATSSLTIGAIASAASGALTVAIPAFLNSINQKKNKTDLMLTESQAEDLLSSVKERIQSLEVSIPRKREQIKSLKLELQQQEEELKTLQTALNSLQQISSRNTADCNQRSK